MKKITEISDGNCWESLFIWTLQSQKLEKLHKNEQIRTALIYN
jgi:hypothetical protein